MLLHHERIAREMGDPALLRLHRMLERLSSVLTVMNTGAHPDDEASGMLAALRFGLGIRIVVACSTRGEGGQNALGPERGAALGVLRTREMEAAARVLDADIVWLGHGPEDAVRDFGFSKNGDDTLARWGEDRIIERLVRAYREERPDIVIPTFLDVPGQHGHHRAMTRAAKTAVGRAADLNAYPQHFSEGLRPWRVSKFYLPAWPGGGATYDDEVPPPEPTLLVRLPGNDTATGAPFARIGEWSRMAHRSQGMGVWLDHPKQAWPLHLLIRTNGEVLPEDDIRDGLQASIGALATSTGLSSRASNLLLAAQREVERAQTAFPSRDAIRDAALAAASAIDLALIECQITGHEDLCYRLSRKLRELDAVLCEVNDVRVRTWVDPVRVSPGSRFRLYVSRETSHPKIAATPNFPKHISILHKSETESTITFLCSVSGDAPITTLYPPIHRSLGGNGEVSLALTAIASQRTFRTIVDLEEPLQIIPQHSMSLNPEAFVTSTHDDPSSFRAEIDIESPPQVPITFEHPDEWSIALQGSEVRIDPPSHLRKGHYRFEAKIDGRPACRITPIAYPHIGTTAFLHRQALDVLALDLRRPTGARVAYVGSGNDRVGLWLSRLGLAVTELDREALRGDLSQYTTIVVGIFAFGRRNDLAMAAGRLRAFVESGGHLVTLYHKPTDGWDPQTIPPRPLEIGSPSLRWRVSDPDAPVTFLAPEHPLLQHPNRIGPDDWAGWDKERGIYFAARWDSAYVPLLSMSDPGDTPLTGALISGGIGQGRHTHVSLVLHHQLDKLVPGAFRLLANLVQPAWT